MVGVFLVDGVVAFILDDIFSGYLDVIREPVNELFTYACTYSSYSALESC